MSILSDRSARFGARTYFVLAGLIVAGCAAVPSLQQRAAGIEGSGLKAYRLFGATILRSVTFVSGAPSSEAQVQTLTKCSDGPIHATIVVYGVISIPASSVERICQDAILSTRFVDNMVGSQQMFQRNYQIYLVPWGTRFSKSTLSWTPMGSLKLVFAAYWYPQDARKGRAYVLNTIAHETAHFWSDIESVEASADRTEAMAYSAGACAQLRIDGQIKEEDLSWVEPTDAVGEMRTSLAEGVNQSKALKPLFENGVLQLHSEQGQAYLQQCQSEIRGYFKR